MEIYQNRFSLDFEAKEVMIIILKIIMIYIYIALFFEVTQSVVIKPWLYPKDVITILVVTDFGELNV